MNASTATNRYPCFDIEVIHAPAHGEFAPVGLLSEPEAAAALSDFLRERYPIGCFVQRDDGCVVLLRSHETPSVCGYISGHGTRVSSLDGHLDGSCATGPLEKCSVVRLSHEPTPRPTVNW